MVKILLNILFYFSSFVIFWAMIGYPLSIRILGHLFRKRTLKKDFTQQPSVTVMVVAHNEDKVIFDKLKNITEINYPHDKIEFLIASDNSTDGTNEIVKCFIQEHPELNIRLFEVEQRKGKTNAQNEAQKTIETEYIVLTDANSILDQDAVKELMSAFASDEIAYVSGRLVIQNALSNDVSSAEATYWDKDLALREIESRIQTITAGNGALYACRNKDYHDFNPIECHDSAMPLYYSLRGKRAIANHDAIAYEKAGETMEDEFSRKVRMSRIILRSILPNFHILNVFKFRWFTFFYLGHRTSRYLLWISHLIVLFVNVFLLFDSWFFMLTLIGQLLLFLLAFIRHFTKTKNKPLTMIYYYMITVVAQWVGVFNIITGKAKPFWEKAETTR